MRKQGMLDFVAGEKDILVLDKTSTEKLAEGMIFLIECEDSRIRDAFECSLVDSLL
jgi:hypothetical protein